MTKNRDVKTKTNDNPRVAELVDQFASMSPDAARKQITVLPYYHQIENEITKSKQGIFVTSYFLTKWAPTLGHPAMNIVLALQKLADKDGYTFASLGTIAERAGVSVPTLKRWLSTNPSVWEKRSSHQRKQWELLHKYFLKSKKRRYIQGYDEAGQSRARRTTNLYQIAVDDPIHPEDEGKLYALAAERIANQEYEEEHARIRQKGHDSSTSSYRDHSDPHRDPKLVIREEKPASVDNSAYRDQSDPYTVGSQGSGISSSYRINVPNVRDSSNKQALRAHPVVQAMSPEKKARKEALAFEIGEQLSTMAGDGGLDLHKSAGFHTRVAFLLPEKFVYEALVATRDAIDDQRAGRKTLRSGPAAYFAGIVRQIAEREKIDLGVEWRAKAASEGR